MANLPNRSGGWTQDQYGDPSWGAGSQYTPQRPSTQVPEEATAGGNDWVLPVIGMSNQTGKFTGSTPQWSSGSYGYKKPASKGGHEHKGVDIYAQEGAAIVAPVNGTIKTIGKGGDGGNYVKIVGDDGYEYYFAHMQTTSPNLSQGMRVNAGGYLGGVGSSGNAGGTQAHLHFEVRKNGKSLSPNSFLSTGKIQNDVSLSSIPGLNSVEQVQAYIDEQMAASFNMQTAEEAGFDPTTWGGGVEPTEDDLARTQVQKGQSFLGSTLNSMSNALAGGGRTPMARMSSAMQATEGGDAVPTAAEQRQVVTP